MPLKDYDITIKDGVLCTPTAECNVPGGLGQFILEGCDKFANNLFQICPFTNTSITFCDFKAQSLNLAANLRHLCGIQQGDVIMTCMKNSLENSLPIAATFFLNAVTCSIDPTLSARDCEHLIKVAEPKLIILDAEVVSNIKTALKGVQPMLIVNDSHSQSKINGSLRLQDLLLPTQFTACFQPVIIEDPNNSIAAIIFSSGTTGLPKGICVSHRSLFYCGFIMHEVMDNRQIFAMCTTFYWISGMTLFVGQFLNGPTKVALRRFDIQEFCETCTKYKVEGAFLATNYLSNFHRNKDLINKTCLKTILAGGMTPSKGQFELLQSTFPQINFQQGYGMTELGGAVCAFTANYRNHIKQFPESTGLPIAGYDLKIVDPKTGKILGPNQQGELCFKSQLCMLGYFKNITDNPFDKAGFLKTGDLGHYGENNLVYISGRCKDMFKYQSWHIVPNILESVIKEHSAIDDAIVFGIPHANDGFLPSAAVTLNKNKRETVQPEDIVNFVAERVADRQKLRGGVFILEELPRTPTGKVQRNKIYDILSLNPQEL